MVSPSLSGLRDLVADPGALTAVWAQIIAWDLFIGRWMYFDGRARRVHPLVMSPLLVGAVLLSPIALPLYLVLRSFPQVRKREVPLVPAAREQEEISQRPGDAQARGSAETP